MITFRQARRLLEGLLLVGGLVVGVDAGGGVGVQRSVIGGGGVALGGLVVLLRQLQHVGGGGAAAQDGGHQHLGQTHGLGQLDQLVHHGGVEGGTGGLKTVLLHEGGDGVVQLHGGAGGLSQHFLHALHAGDDGDLHQVAGHGGGAVLDHHLGKLGVGEHAALNVNVGVDEAGRQVLAGSVDDLGVRATAALGQVAHSGNAFSGDGDVGGVDLCGVDIDQLAATDDYVSGSLPLCHCDEPVIHHRLPSPLRANRQNSPVILFIIFHRNCPCQPAEDTSGAGKRKGSGIGNHWTERDKFAIVYVKSLLAPSPKIMRSMSFC